VAGTIQSECIKIEFEAFNFTRSSKYKLAHNYARFNVVLYTIKAILNFAFED